MALPTPKPTDLRASTRDEIKDAASATNLVYLKSLEPRAWTLREPVARADVHFGCIGLSMALPAGTQGWLYHSVDHRYDRYVWDKYHERECPAQGARVIASTHYYTFAALAVIEGRTCFVSAFKVVETGDHTRASEVTTATGRRTVRAKSETEWMRPSYAHSP